MDLPDFTNDQALLALRQSMGAEASGAFWPGFRPDVLSMLELEQLATKGKDVSIEEIHALGDGTLRYKDSRILVYIRDISSFADAPRFHVADCSTLQKMREQNRFERYVVATRDDGLFLVNRVGRHSGMTAEHITLAVCQNCLNCLKFDGFSYGVTPPAERAKIVKAFNLERFFNLYPKSLFNRVPQRDAEAAPINNYAPQFAEVAHQTKERCGWRCQKCGLDLSAPDKRKFLQVHHLNGAKNDDTPNNLRALCLGCHAKQPAHTHMRRLEEYSENLFDDSV